MILNKFFNFLTKNVDISKERKKEIENYEKTRARLIKIMIKTSKLSKFRLFLITQFMTFFGCGKVKKAPGTMASLMTVALWFLITLAFIKHNIAPIFEIAFWAIFIFLCSLYSVIFTPIYTRNFDTYDHPSIVIDEVVGQLITLTLSYIVFRDYYIQESWILTKIVMLAHMFLSFLLFRTLDIAKPSIIGTIDRKYKNPFGVLLDDVVAGLIGAALIIILFLFYENAIIHLHKL